MNTNESVELIQKENIPSLSFKKAIELEQSPDLREQLVSATRLGNHHKGKIRIRFRDDEGMKAVETTIWATGGKYICLKGGIWIPISRIDRIKTL